MTPTRQNVRRQVRDRGFSDAVHVLSTQDCASLLNQVAGEPPPLDWEKGHAVTSRIFYEVAVHPTILEFVVSILGWRVLLWGATILRREADVRHPWHTDIECADPGSETVSVWIGLQNTTPRSSPRVATYSHTFGVSLQQKAVQQGTRRADIADDDVERWAMELDSRSRIESTHLTDGDALLFDGRLWHGSHNQTDTTRHALLLQYARPATAIRIPDLRQLEWPFRHLARPRPPCLLVRGDDASAANRIVRAPAADGMRGCPRLTSRLSQLRFPLSSDPIKGWKPHHLFRGTTADLCDLECHVSVLERGRSPHPPHRHRQEEILMVLAGEVDVILPALAEGDNRRLSLGRGDFVYYPPQFPHTIEGRGSELAHYLMFKWDTHPSNCTKPLEFQRRSMLDAQRDLREGTRPGISQRTLLEGQTAGLRKLHGHVSVLEPGAGYTAHRDAYDLAIVVFEGEIETLGERLGPHDVVFCAGGEPHDMHNPGPKAASYAVFEFHGSQNGFDARRLVESAGHLRVRTGRERPPEDAVLKTILTLREIVKATLPCTSVAAVVSKGDDRLLDLGIEQASHFPASEQGVYAGYHPADSDQAIARVEDARRRGFQYLIIPAFSLWWLDYYDELRVHLARYPVVSRENACVIFDLRSPAPSPPTV